MMIISMLPVFEDVPNLYTYEKYKKGDKLYISDRPTVDLDITQNTIEGVKAIRFVKKE